MHYTVAMKTIGAVRILGISVTLLVVVILAAVIYHDYQTAVYQRDVRFSTSMTWDAEYRTYPERPFTTAFAPESILLPAPPTNDSEETFSEIEALRDLRDGRTGPLEDSIRNEVSLSGADFYGEAMADFFDQDLHPETAPALNYAWQDLDTLVMAEKMRFDRVRPHILAPDLVPVVEVPAHPAYPSGHSTQAHFFALVLSVIYPDLTDAFMSRADEIAWHREVAGVHYRSDSLAGALLAKQYFDALLEDPVFVDLLRQGRAEVEGRE